MYRIYAVLLFLIFVFRLVNAQDSWSPKLAFYGEGGKLHYTPDESGNLIPDFSHVGYYFGDSIIPDIPSKIVIMPGEGDDGATIQAAIDQVSAMPVDQNGFRGAVLLKSGTYHVAGQIKISTSGVVLRGEGDTESGTIIIAEGTGTRDLIKVDNGKGRSINSASKVNIVEDYVPVGGSSSILGNYPDWDNKTFLRSNSKLALPYICLLILFILLTCPSTGPLLHLSWIPFCTALISRFSPLAKVFNPGSLSLEVSIDLIHS